MIYYVYDFITIRDKIGYYKYIKKEFFEFLKYNICEYTSIDFNKEYDKKEITVDEAKKIIKENLNFNDNTIQHIWNYRWKDEALIRIAKAVK